MCGLKEVFMYPDLCNSNKKSTEQHILVKKHLLASMNITFFCKMSKITLKKVRKVQVPQIWVRGRSDPFPDFVVLYLKKKKTQNLYTMQSPENGPTFLGPRFGELQPSSLF